MNVKNLFSIKIIVFVLIGLIFLSYQTLFQTKFYPLWTYTRSTTISSIYIFNTTSVDPAELLVERSPSPSNFDTQKSNITLVVFLFQTKHHILASLQLYLVRKFAENLISIELFTDGKALEDMYKVAKTYQTTLNSFPAEQHPKHAGPSDRNANVVNWAISLKAKNYLRQGSAILLLDGDVFPVSPFDASTLLNAHDIVCRKHPTLFARFCWIGFICLGPRLYDTIDDFNVAQTMRAGKGYDAGGRTIEYLLKYQEMSFRWMKETILFQQDKDLFWGVFEQDIQWIHQHFNRCDKCGPEIFFSPFNNSNAVFYHMISAASEWRFKDQSKRRQSIYDAVMNSSYGPNPQKYSISDLIMSVKKIQNMPLIPFRGNFSCKDICDRKI